MTRREAGLSLVKKWKESGLSKKAFCLNEGVGIHRLHYWLTRERELESSLGFRKIENTNNLLTGELRIVYPNGVKVECGANMSVVRELIRLF